MFYKQLYKTNEQNSQCLNTALHLTSLYNPTHVHRTMPIDNYRAVWEEAKVVITKWNDFIDAVFVHFSCISTKRIIMLLFKGGFYCLLFFMSMAYNQS